MNFPMYLAAHLGYASPTRMLEEMRPEDLALWQAYFGESPFGEVREDARHAIRSAMFASAHTEKGKRRPKPEDFIPYRQESRQQKVMTPQQQHAWALAWVEMTGGKIEDRHRNVKWLA